MGTFYMLLTLSSVFAPDAIFISHPQRWTNEMACQRALPRMEGALAQLIRYDTSALELFGTTIGGPLNRGYFVSASECRPAEAP
jgi:hypothetical protein